MELEHSVDPAYRGSDAYGVPLAKFMFTDTTLKVLKKLTDLRKHLQTPAPEYQDAE